MLALLVLYAALTPLVVVRPVGTSLVGAPDLLVVPALLVLLAGRIRLTVPILLYLAYCVLAVVATVWAALRAGGSTELLLVVRTLAIAMPFILTYQIRTFGDREFTRIIAAFLLGGAASIIVGFILHKYGIELREGQQRLWLGGGQGSVARAAGLTGNTAGFGHLISIWTLAMVVVAQALRTKWRVVLLLIGLGGGVYMILLSSSRAGLLHVVVGVVAATPWLIRKYSRRFVSAVVLLTAGAGVLALQPYMPSALSDSFVTTSLSRLDIFNMTGESVFFRSVRFANWPYVIAVISDQPVWGLGYKQFANVSGIYVDNAFLSAWVDCGIFGAAAYAGFWLWLIILAVFGIVAVGGFYWVLFGLVVSEVAHAFTVDTYTMWYSMPVSMLLIAVCHRYALGMRVKRTHHGQRGSRVDE